MRKLRKRIFDAVAANKAICILLLLLFAERVIAVCILNVTYSLGSDDNSYVASGILFANTGMITMHTPYPSAQIMPGMTILIGCLSLVFGEGTLLWMVMKLLWILMGTATAWFIYKSVCLFAPHWCGMVAAAALLLPNFVWQDNLILTETPFMLAFTAAVYFTLMMGRTESRRYFWLCLAAYLAALMLKANVAPYPVLALLYLLLVRYDRKLLLRQCVCLVCVVLCVLAPWIIRNYARFGQFIPLTYGAGNPALLGTYQGEGYPEDDTLDYQKNVEQVLRKDYAAYFEPDGSVRQGMETYISLARDSIKARYRQKVWWRTDPWSMIRSYLFLKPLQIMSSTFYWEELFQVTEQQIVDLQCFCLYFCCFGLLAALLLRTNRKQTFWLALVYLCNVYIYATSFAFGRYNVSLLGVTLILFGISLRTAVQLADSAVRAVRAYLPQGK